MPPERKLLSTRACSNCASLAGVKSVGVGEGDESRREGVGEKSGSTDVIELGEGTHLSQCRFPLKFQSRALKILLSRLRKARISRQHQPLQPLAILQSKIHKSLSDIESKMLEVFGPSSSDEFAFSARCLSLPLIQASQSNQSPSTRPSPAFNSFLQKVAEI